MKIDEEVTRLSEELLKTVEDSRGIIEVVARLDHVKTRLNEVYRYATLEAIKDEVEHGRFDLLKFDVAKAKRIVGISQHI